MYFCFAFLFLRKEMKITRNILPSSTSSYKLSYFLAFYKFAHLDFCFQWQAVMMVDPDLEKVDLPEFKFTN